MTWKSMASIMGMALTPSLMTAMMMAMMAIGSQRPWSNKASLAPLRGRSGGARRHRSRSDGHNSSGSHQASHTSSSAAE